MTQFVALRMPGSSTHVDDDVVGNTYVDSDTAGRQVKIIDFARDEDGMALHPSNGNATEISYEAEVVTHKNKKLIGRHSTIKASTIENKYLPHE